MKPFKHALAVRALPALFCLASCGIDPQGPGGSAPVISVLSYLPTSVSVGQPTNINATLHFEDPDGDVRDLLIEFRLPTGVTQSLPRTPAQDVQDRTTATLSVVAAITAPVAGRYDFNLRLADAAGHESNRLSGILEAE